MDPEDRVPEAGPEPPPPVLGSWKALYAFVLGVEAAIVLALYLLTRASS